ncbi:CB1 cannabinoid receptor-interacting protein 1 [Trichoplax sp. H2]|nr:CB1 cannabinoid receptor-interacting protein 1 [Trichoplax sp. H2]|eukprot:RDD40101.1 CB1 cannabinoid receptor-interacting protein 1 [Trichoplax sp. H2]
MKSKVYSINLSVSREDNSHIYFKCDGGRFDSAYTYKMNVDCLYKLTFACKPHIVIEQVKIDDKVLPLDEDTKDLNRSLYKCVWKSDSIIPTKSKGRSPLRIVLDIRDAGSVEMILQCKFYKRNSSHDRWGTQVNSIQFDYAPKDETGPLAVIKQSIL